MPGGLLNLVGVGNQNAILNSNPSRTFFKSTYAKYTNFGLQKFRVDFEGQRELRLTEPSFFRFKMPRYADLLMDTYFVVTLPTIWSPVVPPPAPAGQAYAWRPYEFKWIKDIGSQIIERVRFRVGGELIQEFSGQYLRNLVERDFTEERKKLYYEMTGNVPELNDPASRFPHEGYPSVAQPPGKNLVPTVAGDLCRGPAPSIYGRQLYIPLNIWFTLAANMAFPMASLQYAELFIEVECRPVRDLFVIRDVSAQAWQSYSDWVSNAGYPVPPAAPGPLPTPPGPPPPPAPVVQPKYHAPDFTDPMQQLYRFLQPPPEITDAQWPTQLANPISEDLRDPGAYLDRNTSWAADIHLVSTYAFLTDEEVRVFAARPQKYLVRQVYEYKRPNIIGPSRHEIESSGLVCSWMWFLQRSDVARRNQWSNYTNWEDQGYNPMLLIPGCLAARQYALPAAGYYPPSAQPIPNPPFNWATASGPPWTRNGLWVTPEYRPAFDPSILETWGLLLDGKDREVKLPDGVWHLAEQYASSRGNGVPGLYHYNFCLHTDPSDGQPSGAMNLSKFNQVEFELSVRPPPLNPTVQLTQLCAPPKGGPAGQDQNREIGIDKPAWRVYEYNYCLTVIEERYNILSFSAGNAGLEFAR